ncbi:MAG TPA: DUF433 domain-containing protein [Pricia sp.]|nr:DUF433 domain-containing protein [Pricia sp.]
MQNYKEHIVSDYKVLLGKPIIKGTRISVEFVLKKLSEGATVGDLVEEHKITFEPIYAALDYASAQIKWQSPKS